MQNINMS